MWPNIYSFDKTVKQLKATLFSLTSQYLQPSLKKKSKFANFKF